MIKDHFSIQTSPLPPPLDKEIMLGNFLEYFVLQIECIDLAFNFLSAVARPGLCKTAQESAGGVGGGLQILANCQFIQQPTEQRTS